jgi:hypothetical protein
MTTSTLITVLIILLVLLIPLLLSYLVYPDEKISKRIPKLKKRVSKVDIDPLKPLTFEQILSLFSNKKTTKSELREGIEQLVKNHGKIHAKLGDLPHPDFKRYREVIMALCSNPQADKDIILAIDQKLRVKNPKYSLNIDDAVDKGIAKRGF